MGEMAKFINVLQGIGINLANARSNVECEPAGEPAGSHPWVGSTIPTSRNFQVKFCANRCDFREGGVHTAERERCDE
jgi:hypothetical protein